MLPTPLFGPVPGGIEMMILLLVAVLLFGANKLPKLARLTENGRRESRTRPFTPSVTIGISPPTHPVLQGI